MMLLWISTETSLTGMTSLASKYCTKVYNVYTVCIACSDRMSKSVIKGPYWYGGTESHMLNKLESIATSP